jgi:membrane protease YdiL (CAAX protease family)
MTHTRDGTQTPARIFSILLIAFLMIKVSALVIPELFVRHLGVACVLFGLPAMSVRRSYSFFSEIIRRPKNYWGYLVCFLYILIPVIILGTVYSAQWNKAFAETKQWILSSEGFSAIIIAPVAEEFFFRGWLLKAQIALAEQKQSTKALSGAGLFWICYFNALFFWLLHFPVSPDMFALWSQALAQGVLPVPTGPFFLGIIAASLTLLTGNPAAALLIHSLSNTLGPLWWPLLRDFGMLNYFYR